MLSLYREWSRIDFEEPDTTEYHSSDYCEAGKMKYFSPVLPISENPELQLGNNYMRNCYAKVDITNTLRRTFMHFK